MREALSKVRTIFAYMVMVRRGEERRSDKKSEGVDEVTAFTSVATIKSNID